MELRQLEYFQVIASFRNLTKAAESLHITQPALSRILRRLEEDIGFTLFDRRNNRIELTESGKIFLDAVTTALGALQKGLDECHALTGETNTALSIAFLYEGTTLKPFSPFQEKYPSVRVRQFLYPIDTIQNMLLSQEIDLAIAPDRFSAPDIGWELLMDEELLVLLPERHPLQGIRTLPVSELQNIAFVFNDAVYERESFDRICAENGVFPKVLFQSNEHNLINEYMNLGEPGALLLPASYYWDRKRSAEDAAPAQNLPVRLDPPLFRRQIGIASLRGRKLSAVAAGYRHFVTEYFRNLSESMDVFLKTEFQEE